MLGSLVARLLWEQEIAQVRILSSRLGENMDKISLLYDITDEQLLDFALMHVAYCNSDEKPHVVAEKIVTVYAINELLEKQDSFTEEEVNEKYRELIADYILTNMVHSGLLEVDISDKEIKYVLSEEGKKYARKNGQVG
jgi:L-arabinose isomerase